MLFTINFKIMNLSTGKKVFRKNHFNKSKKKIHHFHYFSIIANMMNFLGNQTYHQKILNNFLVRWTIQKIKIVLEWPKNNLSNNTQNVLWITHFVQYLRRFSWKKNNCELRNLTYGTDINLPIKHVIIFFIKK